MYMMMKIVLRNESSELSLYFIIPVNIAERKSLKKKKF